MQKTLCVCLASEILLDVLTVTHEIERSHIINVLTSSGLTRSTLETTLDLLINSEAIEHTDAGHIIKGPSCDRILATCRDNISGIKIKLEAPAI